MIRLLIAVCIVVPFMCRAIPIDNGIVGPLNVTCLETSIMVNFKTLNPFNGRVYIKGSYADPQCSADFSQNTIDEGVMVLPFSDCSMQRTRMRNNGGVKHTTTVIVSFHPIFITKVDRAFRIQCLYERHDYQLTQALEVSTLPTIAQDYQEPPPHCTYTLHAGSKHGPPVKSVNVGDKVVHKWNCETANHAMLVHSCFVKAPGHGMVEIVSRNGCGLDAHIVGNLTYEGGLHEAWVATHAFKFQDVTDLSFSCKIQLCFKSDTACLQNTPPSCGATTDRRYRRSLFDESTSMMINSGSIQVLDLSDRNDSFATEVEQRQTLFDEAAQQQLNRAAVIVRKPTGISDSTAQCHHEITVTVFAISVLFTCFLSFLISLALARYLWYSSGDSWAFDSAQHLPRQYAKF